jgi:hypothetical protein
MVRSSFTTPFVWKNSRRTEIVTVAPQAIVSYDLEGRELWRYRGSSMVAAPTPVADGDLLFVGCGSPSENVRPLLAIRVGPWATSAQDNATSNAGVAWFQERGGPDRLASSTARGSTSTTRASSPPTPRRGKLHSSVSGDGRHLLRSPWLTTEGSSA